MKKRVLCLAISALMAISSFSTVFAATDYDGIKPLQTEEKVLDQLKADVEAQIFDLDQHEIQYGKLSTVNSEFATRSANADWSSYIARVYTGRPVDTHIDLKFLEDYMKVLAIAEENPTGQIATALATADAAHDTTGLGLKASFEKYDTYKEAMRPVLRNNRAELDAYTLTDEQIEAYLLKPTNLLFQAIFSLKGAGTDNSTQLEYNYASKWLGDDHAKKLLAITFGEALTKELSYDIVDGAQEGVVRTLKAYLKTSDGMLFVRDSLSEIMVVNEEEAVSALYEFIGDIIYKAYEGKTVQKDLQMLFGGNGETGAFELAMKAVDADYKGANVLLNLFLSEYVQTNIANNDLITITSAVEKGSQAETDARIMIHDNAKIKYVPQNLFEEYGIDNEDIQKRLTLFDNLFELVCYVEDSQNPGAYVENSEYVTCDGSLFNVTKVDTTKGETYDAYLVLYRKGMDETGANDTFIESYPVTIENKVIRTGGGGGGTTRYTLTYETNGGSAIDSERFDKGTTVELTKVPVKDGYTFAGWYLDKELTKKIDAVVMSNSVTVYAAWAEVEGVEVPEMLNGDDHFAYVIGYPDGTVRPQNNITRAEAATIIFRLLKDEVREENLTTENSFTDSNDGDWYNAAVSTLAKIGIVNGRTETEYAPNEYITRAEFATIFARFAQFDVEGNEAFTDVDSHWAKESILESAAYGWIKGYEDNSFRPNNKITRAEAMTLINRVLRRLPETKEDLLSDMVKWSDNNNENTWYYLAVQEATNSHEYEKKNNVNETWTKITENRDWTTYEK